MSGEPGARALRDHCEVITKGTTPTTVGFEYVEHGVRFVKVESLQDGRIAHDRCAFISPAAHDALSRSQLRAGDVLFSIAGTLGRTAVVALDDLPANTNQAVAIVRPASDISSGYLRALLETVAGTAVAEHGRGVGLQNINLRQLGEVRVEAPPLDEQRRIVAKLDALRARSRRAKDALDAVPALLDRLRQSILAAAFRGDLTADWREQNPNVEPASELLKRIRVERRKRWEEAELAKLTAKGKPPKDDRWKEKYVEPEPVDEADLPELPDGWCWASIETAGDVLLGRRRADREYVVGVDGREPYPYLRVANLKEDRFKFDDVLSMPFSPSEIETYRLRVGDIVLAEGQSLDRVGESAVYRGGYDPAPCIQATLHRFRAHTGIDPEYAQLAFMHCVRTGTFRRSAAITTNIAHLTSERLRPIPLPLAPSSEQREMVRRARAMLDAAARVEATLASVGGEIANADGAILAAAFRGDLLERQSMPESVVGE